MMKKIGCVLMMLLLLPCFALANGWGTLFEPPMEVLEHISERWPDYDLEDYCEIRETPKGAYGFALLKSSEERLLVGYHEENGEMKYWLKNAGAVPQGNESASFFVSQEGEMRLTADGDMYEDDGLTFGVLCTRETEESIYEKWIRYHWEGSDFVLTGYKAGLLTDPMVDVEEGLLYVSDEANEVAAKVYGQIQRDIRYVSWNALPKTIEEARETISTAPRLVIGNFHPQEIKFAGGQKYPVYTGPGEEYARSGNGKGQVSTNDWIEVFGQYGDFIMIQYDISAEQFRIGWIDADSLPQSADVPQLGFEFLTQKVLHSCVLTDDPLKSGKPILSLKAGTEVVSLADFAEYYYVEVTVDGETYWGFVDADCVTKG